jgi:hypothetical protein
MTQKMEDSDARLMEMLAAQAAHRDGSADDDEDDVASNEKLSDDKKRDILQKALNMAASNGDVERIQKILGGKAKDFVDINAPDEEGTSPLIYASCFVSLRRLYGSQLTILGSRSCCNSSIRGRGRCRQAGSKPVERSDVGYDKPAQGDCQSIARPRRISRCQIIIW